MLKIKDKVINNGLKGQIIDEIKPVIFKLEDNIIGFVLPIREY